ncbi:MAG: thioredoxin domain-containing protein [Deltaproteobacteria bacterium]|nr:MAG: thioredoxin domain-containing protein [Deltaproteobacteria bacterium]
MPVLEQVLEKYSKDVKLVFKNFPLRNHRYARQAAIASLAAEEQGKFWEFHDLLFKDHKSLNNQKIREIAEKLGLDMEKFARDARDAKVQTRITRDMSDAAKAGVRATPTIFINGRVLRGHSLKAFDAMIDKELERISKRAGKPAS